MLPLKRWIDGPGAFGIAALLLAAVFGAVTLVPFEGAASVREMLLRGNYQGAFEQLGKQANGGDIKAANTLGNLYYLGLGTKKDYRRAAGWYVTAARDNYGPAQANLGHLYSQGLGVPKDLVRTLGWYRLAQQSGYGEIEELLKRKTDENQFNANLIQRANTLFSNLKEVKKNLADELQRIEAQKD